MALSLPTSSFNEELLIRQELEDYEETVNAVGLLQVKERETDELVYERDGNPWFLIEHVDSTKFCMDTSENYFLRDDDRYTYKWVAYRMR